MRSRKPARIWAARSRKGSSKGRLSSVRGTPLSLSSPPALSSRARRRSPSPALTRASAPAKSRSGQCDVKPLRCHSEKRSDEESSPVLVSVSWPSENHAGPCRREASRRKADARHVQRHADPAGASRKKDSRARGNLRASGRPALGREVGR